MKTETGTHSGVDKLRGTREVRRRAKPMNVGTKHPHKNHFCCLCCWKLTWTSGSGSSSSPSTQKQSSIVEWGRVRGLELHGARRDVEHGRVKLLPLERRALGVPALLQHLVNFLLAKEGEKLTRCTSRGVMLGFQ